MTRYNILLSFLVIITILSTARCGSSNQDQSGRAAIKVMPDFALPNLSGKEVKSSAFDGKILVVDFWATWCSFCRAEIPDFIELQKKYRDKDVEIVAIAVEGTSLKEATESVKAVVKKEGINYTTLLGNSETMDTFHVDKGFPTTFVIDKKRHIRHIFVGKKDKQTFENAILSILKDTPKNDQTK